MSDDKQIDVGRALDQFFAIVRHEAMGNPRFAKELAEALGYEVVFRGPEALLAVDPVIVAMKGQKAFRETFLSFKAADLKKLVKSFGLGTDADLKAAKTAPLLVDLLWEGANAKMRDRGM
ncbi:MAG: hypothetical protein R3D51_17635 [Hyphomicrobiaceae bacterium]